MKNNYSRIVGLLLIVTLILSTGPISAQKLQVKKNQQTEPAKTTKPTQAQVRKRTSSTTVKPAEAVSKRETGAQQAGGSNSSVALKDNTTSSLGQGSEKKKNKKPTLQEQKDFKDQYYLRNGLPKDTIKPKLKPKPIEKIVGGEDTEIEQIPWQVWLGGCGGTIIGEEWVVTAAHCGPGVGDDVYAGMTSISDGADQMRTVAEVFYHPGWDGNTSNGHDIALIRVSVPFTFNTKVQPIPYATPADEANGLTDPCTLSLVSGWGTLSPGGSSPDHLQAVWVPIVSNELTDAAYVGLFGLEAGWITADQLAAGDFAPQDCTVGDQDGGEDSCQGDSGGPLVVANASGTGYILAGIVSWGESCADPDYPGLYGRVSEFASFIEEITGIVNNQYPSLIISEVVHGDEAGGNPKYVEIHNAGTETYNLNEVAIRVFENGASTPTATIDLPNVDLEPGETYVVANAAFQASWGGAFTTAVPDMINAGITGNGNDVYQLFDSENDGVIDVFGQVGTSGTYWDYEESIVVRNPWVIAANSGGFNEESFEDDWEVDNYDADDATPGSHTAETPAFDVSLTGITGINEGQTFVGCDGTANVFPGVVIYNAGTDPFSSVTLEIDLNGSTSSYVANFPSLDPGESVIVELPGLSITTENEFTYSVEVDDETDGNPTNNEAPEVEFNTIIFNDAQTLVVNTTTDEYPSETYWVVTDVNENIIATSDPMIGSSLNTQSFCVSDGTYTITLFDTWGDGIFDGGGLELTLEDGTPIVAIAGDDPAFDNQCFFCDPVLIGVSANFPIPFVAVLDAAVEFSTPAGNFTYESCTDNFTPGVTITNTGTLPVSSVVLNYGIGTASTVAAFDGFIIQPGNSRVFELPEITLTDGDNDLLVEISEVNGETDSNPANDGDDLIITFTLNTELNNIVLILYTDSYPEETSWEVTDGDGTVVASGDGYPENEENVIPICLPDGTYTFTLFDSFGDGIFEEVAALLQLEDGTLIAQLSGNFSDGTGAEFELPFTPVGDVSISIVAPEDGVTINNCSPVTPLIVTITNEGNIPITAVDVTYSIGANEETLELTGLLNAGESAEIELGMITLAAGLNAVTTAITDVNQGGADTNPTNDEAESVFNFTLNTEETALSVELELDIFASETSWEIEDSESTIVASGGGYAGLGNTTQIEIVCLPSGCYTFKLLDSFGDGGPGVNLLVNGSSVGSIEAEDWGEEESASFCISGTLPAVTNVTALAVSDVEIDVSWSDESDNEDGFRVQMASSALGPWTTVEETIANVETVMIGDLTVVTEYFFRVQAFNATGTSAWSEIVSATTLITGVEGSVENSVHVYPNPTTTNSFSVSLRGELGNIREYSVIVTDSRGLIVERFMATHTRDAASTFQLKNPTQGLYVVKINTGKHTVVKKLFVR